MLQPAKSLDEALAAIADGCLLVVPREVSGVPMAATRALIRRGVKRLHLLALPTSSLQADLLIGAGCVATLETSAVSLGEFGPAPRFTAAITGGTITMKDATCPALHAALQAAEKGVPFMPLRGLIGSDVLKYRDDWKVIDNPFGNADPIVLLPAIKPDVALLHAPMADRLAMSGSAGSANSPPWRMRRRRPSPRWKKSTTAICSTIRCSPPARCPAFTSRASRWPSAAAGRSVCRITTAPTPSIWRFTRRWRRRRKALPSIWTSMSMNAAPREFRDEELLADVIARLIGDVRHVAVGNASPIPATAALLARERGHGRPYVSLLQSRKHNFFTDGARELFDCAGQGRIDVFFLSGGQIDGARQRQSGVAPATTSTRRCAFPARSARPISITWCRR